MKLYAIFPEANKLLSPVHRFAFDVAGQPELTDSHVPSHVISVSSMLVTTFCVPGPAGGGVAEPEGAGVGAALKVSESELVVVLSVAADCK